MMTVQASQSRTSFIWKDQEVLFWWLPLVIVFVIALGLRLAYVGTDLPANEDPDEFYYFVWARAVKETGFPNVESGSGYPPGLLYLLAFEQKALEIVRGPDLNKSTDYFIVARVVNGIFGALCIFLIAYLARWTGKSRLAGIASAFALSTLGIMVSESRRGAANAPWIFFTLLGFVLLFIARDTRKLSWLYVSVVIGVVSFLFKYQSGVFLCLPFIYGLLYFRNQKRIFAHMAGWAVALIALLLWLIFVYQILEIMNTPTTDTASVVQGGELVGLQSFYSNWKVISNGAGSSLYAVGVIGAGVLALLALRFSRLRNYIDSGEVFSLLLFGVLFYLLMSLFRSAAISKWLALISVIIVLGQSFLFSISRLLANALSKLVKLPALQWLLPLAIFTWYASSLGVKNVESFLWVHENVWSRPSSLNTVNLWYANNVPQGGRLVSEVNKLVYNYVYAPNTVHTLVVNSIFQEPVEDYRNRGYEYLIWNDRKSYPTDSLEELDARMDELTSHGAVEVLRLTHETITGSEIVVFRLDPLPEHETYAWFTPAISFRGYDLEAGTFKPGTDIDLKLYWMSAEVIPNNYIVFVHLIDPQTGSLIAGQDGPPDNGNTPTWKWLGDMQFIHDPRSLSIPPDAPPGTYTLRIGMYDADTKARVDVLDLQYQPTGDTLVLQDVVIEK